MAINRDKVLEAAQKYVEKKKYDKAVAELRKLVEADPNDARTLLKIGDLQAKQGLYADAINTYESVGKLYANQGFALKAIAVYKQIREIIGKHVPQLEERYGHIAPKLAELYQQLGLTSDALAALDEVATRLQRQQKDQEAIEVFRRIVELDPTNPLPHLRLAEALSRVKDVEGAVNEFKTAASQLSGIGRRDDALKVLERLLHHKPDPEQARICAELYLARSQPQDGMQALAKLQICFQANPRDFDTLSLLARAFNAIGQGAKAIEVQKEMARVARDTGKTDLFREILERLQRVAPQDEGVRRLAQQTGSVQAPPPYGSASMAPEPSEAPAPREEPQRYPAPPAARDYGQQQQQQPYPQQPPAVWGQQQQPSGALPPPYTTRPNTQPLQRPNVPQELPEPIEEVDEISYSSYEEDVEELVEDADEAELVEDAQSYGEASYGEAAVEGDGYAQEEGGAYADPNAEGGQAYGEPQAQAYGNADAYGYADNQGYVEQEQDYVTADGEGGEAAVGYQQEDLPPGSEADTAEHVAKTLADANAFRRVRLYAKAIETLNVGLEIEPRSMDLHEVYRDVLIESGQTDEAVQEMLIIASLYVDALDGDSAARALQDVLAFDPQNARAIEMLQELGYEIVDENEPGDGQVEADPEAGGYAEEVHDARLPSYDLEEMGAADVSSQYADDRQIHINRGPSQAPPGYGEQDAVGGDSLPSFPLDEPDAAQDAYAEADEHVPSVRPMHGARSRPAPADVDEVAPRQGAFSNPIFGGRGSQSPPRASQKPASIGAAASRELEDALDEAEFFCSRGLFDDARAILAEQLNKHPNNPLLRERLVEIDAQETQRGSGAREKPREQADQAYDIANSLDALESLDYANIQPAEGHADGEEQIDVEEVFAKFKEGVAKQISVEDSDSHYNLGIAYKEMLLLDDAIREFDVAAMDPKRECVCRSMIGMIQIERGNVNEAIDAFLQGLNAPIKEPQQETVLCFEIGTAYEAKKMNKDALNYYQKAMRRDPNYRDVQERVRRLAKAEPKQSTRQAAVGADDEFDRAFDDLLSKA